MTRRTLIEQIRRLYYGGTPSDDATLTENEVNLYINQAIAYIAKVNYTDAIKLDGVETVSDAFYATFKNLSMTKDNDTGYWYVTLPHAPLGLSRGYGISTVTFPVVTGGLAKAPTPISPRELDFIDQVKMPPSKVFYWAEGNKLWFKSPYYNLNGKFPIVRMVSAENSDITSEVNVPGEYISDIINWILNQLKVRKGMPEDTTNDGLDKA
jgi:hypothetical protein